MESLRNESLREKTLQRDYSIDVTKMEVAKAGRPVGKQYTKPWREIINIPRQHREAKERSPPGHWCFELKQKKIQIL